MLRFDWSVASAQGSLISIYGARAAKLKFNFKAPTLTTGRKIEELDNVFNRTH